MRRVGRAEMVKNYRLQFKIINDIAGLNVVHVNAL